MQNTHRMSSIFVIAGFSVCFFLIVNSVQLLNTIMIENQEVEQMTTQWFDFDTDGYLQSVDMEVDGDHLAKSLFSILNQDPSRSISIVDCWIYEENVMDSVEVNIIFQEREDDHVCLIGKAYQEHFWNEPRLMNEVVLAEERYHVDGIQSDSSPYITDDKIYLYWNNMSDSQQKNVLEIIASHISGGVIFTIELAVQENIQNQYKQKILDETGISLIEYPSDNTSENFDVRLYTSFGKILCPIILFFSMFNAATVIRFWIRANKTEWCIRRYVGYDLGALWWVLIKQMIKMMCVSMLLGMMAEVVYVWIFQPIVLIQKNIILQLIMSFAIVVALLLIFSAVAIYETAKCTGSIERTNL